MSKRNAATSLDEWLEEGVLHAEANQVRRVAVPVEEALEPTPTVAEVPAVEEAHLLPTVSAKVAELDNT